MSKWEENVRKVVPYVPGEQPQRALMIKLNTNENPYPPAPGVRQVLERFDVDRLRLYPDPVVGKLNTPLRSTMVLRQVRCFPGLAPMMYWL